MEAWTRKRKKGVWKNVALKYGVVLVAGPCTSLIDIIATLIALDVAFGGP
jgi:hypothetical protein